MNRYKFLFVLLALALASCATAETEEPVVQAKEMTFDEARDIVASFEAKQARKTGSNPLRDPKSLDDVLEILRTDQLDLFAHGVVFAGRQGDSKALTLRAQIELAWGEAQVILADILADTTTNLRTAMRALEAKEAAEELDEKGKAYLADLRKAVGQATATSEALSILANEHLTKGARMARAVIDKNPNDYHGYRVAADFHRLRQDWPSFFEMLKKVEETNPNSNGLMFLKGVAAAYREDDPAKAIDFFKKALERDNKFVRSQVHVYLLQRGIANKYAEYQKIKAMNPNHQIVVWAGEFIESAYKQLGGEMPAAPPQKPAEKPKEPEKPKDPEKSKEPEKKDDQKGEKK
jgi:tetratricopeptide (TPR) repeat protein